MAAGMYLEHYLDSIENLPFELQRNFQLMRDLDQRTEDLKSEIDKLATEYISNARTLSSEEKLGLLKQIQEAYGKCKEFGDDKVQLAMQTYEMVDKHIRRLDTDLARFEADLKEKQIESSDYDSSSSKGKKKLSPEAQVTAVARSAFLQLRLIHQLRPYLEYDCLVTVTHALVTSRLDFCNALYVGLPLKTVRILQLVQNRAARLLTGTGVM
ncbi:Inhibitor of growth protein 4 [Varanus komodoensis]|nr:Inhibitor of growth protein 4 [Varanus komodoensis]